MKVLEVHSLNKYYGSVHAVNNVDLHLETGQILGLLGPNGSGKSTTLGMLLGITQPSSGSFQWFNESDSSQARLRIGALLETPNFYPYLDADENLKIIAQIKGSKEDITPLLELVDMAQWRKTPFSNYSLGMKQRLAIAAAMVGNPDVLIFDEPTNGLDPKGIAEVRNTLIDVAQSGKPILMASHMLDEVEKICSHVAILKKGKLLAQGPVGALLGDQVLVELAAQNQSIDQLLSALAIKDYEEKNGIYYFQLSEDWDGTKINQLAQAKGIILSHLAVKKRSLESEFLAITED